MQLLGYSLLQLLAVFGAAATVAVLLHLLRAHRKRVEVPYLPLWDGVLSQRDASQLLSRMPRWLAMLLTLLILLLLSIALGEPRLDARSALVTHRVVLIDSGLASQAVEHGERRIDTARRWARRLSQQAGPLLPTMLVTVDAAPAPLGPFSSDPAALERLIAELEPSDLTTDVERAHRFALDALGGRSPAEIVFIGNGRAELSEELSDKLAGAGISARRIAVGSLADNVAITTFAARRYPLDRDRSELLLGLENQGQSAADVEVTLLGDGSPIDVRTFRLAAGAREQRVFDDVAFAGGRLEAELKASDPARDILPADSRAYAVLPPREKLRVLCVTEGNRYLEAALLLDEYFEVDVAPPGSQVSFSDYDVAIFDRIVPADLPGIPALYLAPAASAAFPSDGTIQRPRFDSVRREHPILRHVALSDVNIAASLRLQPRPGDAVLASSTLGPLLVSGEREGQPFVALAFDVAQSDLPLRVAWPLLLINTLDWFANERKELSPVHVVGEIARVAVSAQGGSTSIRTPSGELLSVPVTSGSIAFSADRAGFFEIVPEGRLVAVGIDAAAAPALARGATTFDTTSLDRPRMPDLWMIAIALALAVIAFEWLAFHRRWAP